MERHRYVVSVDYGTTFTGAAYASSSRKSIYEVNVITNWPGRGEVAVKTPSKISYRDNSLALKRIKIDEESKDTEDINEEHWGFHVEPGMECHSWTKLLLEKDAKITKFDDPNLHKLAMTATQGIMKLPPGKTATQVAGDYLRGVYNFIISELERRATAAVIKITPLEFWLTVPATWSDQAKKATRDAAKLAGFGTRPGDTIYMITEPEAAAVAALSGLVKEGVPDQVKPGDGILVNDCGGGTVDINTYIIKSAEPLEFEELVVGQGDRIGSTYVDQQFHHWMSSMFGPDFDNLDPKKIGPNSKFMQDFERLKRNFGRNRNKKTSFEVSLVMPKVKYSKHYDDEECVLRITKDNLEAFFQPSVSKIIELLEEKICKANKAMPKGTKISVSHFPDTPTRKLTRSHMIILVGGFGDSQYLHDTLQAWCKKNGGIKLLCPAQPQAAIVKGAALRGLGDIKPSIRRCRRHYGFAVNDDFRKEVDPIHRMTTCDWNPKRKLCSNRMLWPIVKGDETNEDTTISNEISRVHEAGDELKFRMKLFASDADKQADYKEDAEVDLVGVMIYDFTKIPLSRFETKRRHGKRIYYLSFNVEVLMGTKEGVLRFHVLTGKDLIGEMEIDFSMS